MDSNDRNDALLVTVQAELARGEVSPELRARAEAEAPSDGLKAKSIYIELRIQELTKEGAFIMNQVNPDVIDFAQAKAASRAGENAWLAPMVIIGVFVLFVGLGIALVLTHQVPG